MSLDTIFSMLTSTTGVDNSIGYSQNASIEKSPVYNVGGAKMTASPKTPIPIVFGRSLVAPNLINYYVEQGENETLNLLFGVCTKSKAISNIKINNNKIENFYGTNANDPYGENAEIITTNGAFDQKVVKGFDDLHTPNLSVYQILSKNNPYTYTSNLTNLNAFKITFLIPNLYQLDNNNTVLSWYFSVQIEYRRAGASEWTFAGIHEFNNKTDSFFKRSFKSGYLESGQYEIKITKTSNDQDSLHFGSVILYEIDEIVSNSLIYPQCSLLAIRLVTTNEISNCTCIVTGCDDIQIPDIRDSNNNKVDWESYYYDSTDKCYKLLSTGAHLIWDGITYINGWTGNNAWCLKYLLLNEDDGLGHLIKSNNINNESFLLVSQYCDEGILGVNGKIEKRMRLDLTIDDRKSANEWFEIIQKSMRAKLKCNNNIISLAVEKQQDPSFIFNSTDIILNTFKIDYITEKSIPNVLNISFYNKDKDFTNDVYPIVNQDSIKLGENLEESSVQLLGTCRISQIMRDGKILSNKLKYNKSPISFSTHYGAFTAEIMDTFLFQNDLNGWGEGGKLLSDCSKNIIKLDKNITLDLGLEFKISIQNNQTDTIETRIIESTGGQFNEITVSEDFSFIPQKYDKWYVYQTGTEKKYRVVDIVKNSNGIIDIKAVNYSDLIYDYSALTQPVDNYKYLNLDIPLVTNLVVEEKVSRLNDGTIQDLLQVSFLKPTQSSRNIKVAKEFGIFISDNDGKSWSFIGNTNENSYTISTLFSINCRYTVSVVTITTTGDKSIPANSPQASITIAGWNKEPLNVSNFNYTFTDEIVFTWDKVQESDIAGYEIRIENDNWGVDNSNLVWRGSANSYTIIRPMARAGIIYYIKSYNRSGIYCVNPSQLTPINPAPSAPILLHTDLFQKVFLMWNDIPDSDLIEYEVWQNIEDVWTGIESNKEKIVHKSKGTSAIVIIPNNPTYFRVRGIDKFGGGDWSNSVTVDQIQIISTDIGQGQVNTDNLADNSITTSKILAGQIVAGHIAANQITAEKINVECLSAISTNIGCINAGTITGALIKTSNQNFRTELDNSGLKSYNADGIKTVELMEGNLKLYDPCCCDIYSCLNSGGLVFHHPYGDVPYLKRLKSGVALTGSTVELAQWYEKPEVMIGIKKLSSYNSANSESSQEWCVYADNFIHYDNGGSDFGWKFDTHAKLVITGGSRDECIDILNFDVSKCTGINTCSILVKSMFQLWCHDIAPSTFKYGQICYEIRYRVCGAPAWCGCCYSFVQPHTSVQQMYQTNILCNSLNVGSGNVYEISLHQVSLNWLDSGIASGTTICCLCCYNYQVDCSYWTSTVICSSPRDFNLCQSINGAFICSVSCNLSNQFGNWDGNIPMCCSTIRRWVSSAIIELCADGGYRNENNFDWWTGGQVRGTIYSCTKSINSSNPGTTCYCLHNIPSSSLCTTIFCQNFVSSISTNFGVSVQPSGLCWCDTTDSFARVSGTICATQTVCYKECLICTCLCCYWYPAPTGEAACCDYKQFYSLTETTDTECILDPNGEVSWLAVAYS